METIACAACGTENNIVRSTCEKCGADLLVIKNILNNANKHYNAGLQLAQQGRNEEAIAELKAAVELWGKNPNFHNLLGTIYARRGLYDLATKEWEATLALEPLFAKAHTSIEKARKMELHVHQELRNVPYKIFAVVAGLVGLAAIVVLIIFGFRLQTARSEMEDLKSQLAAGSASQDVQQLKIALGLKDKQVTNLEGQLGVAQRELQNRKEQIDTLGKKVEALESRPPVATDDKRLQQLTAQLQQLEKDKKDLAGRLQRSENGVAERQAALDNSRALQKRTQTSLDQLQTRWEGTASELQALQAHEDLIAQAYRLWHEEKYKEVLFVLEQMEGLAMNKALVGDLRDRAQEQIRLREDPLYQARQEAALQAAKAEEQQERQYYAGLKVEEGLSRLREGDLEGARRQFEAALAIDPAHDEAQRQLQQVQAKLAEQRQTLEEQLRTAQIALGLGRFDEAIEGFEAVLAAQPDHPTAKAGLQAAQESKAGQEQAETRRKQQITLLSSQASRAAEAGQVEKALELYRQWLQLEPDNRSARRDLERIQRKERERIEAMNEKFSNGRRRYNERDYDHSIEEFEQALQRARLPEEKQKIQSALSTVRQAQAESRQAEQERARTIAAAYQEADDLYQDGLFEQALEEVNRVLALDPDHRDARRLKRSIESALEKS